ncbi:hypothetical protein Pmi06nite_76700 [Planotetraspora mira]|uniref:Uncharacterized protein n=1 Tax=Planotetraspora mira TaxID=58121 RepID=A0A8J3TX58_9ACTN|nr:hypothetical protein Pmi06nite_76700 [Planotetraspora mira]
MRDRDGYVVVGDRGIAGRNEVRSWRDAERLEHPLVADARRPDGPDEICGTGVSGHVPAFMPSGLPPTPARSGEIGVREVSVKKALTIQSDVSNFQATR